MMKHKVNFKKLVAGMLSLLMMLSTFVIVPVTSSAAQTSSVADVSRWNGTASTWSDIQGLGTKDAPYVLESAADYASMLANENTWHSGATSSSPVYFKLMTDMDFGGENPGYIASLGVAYVVLDGNGHTIYNQTTTWGVFEHLGNGSVIKDLSFVGYKSGRNNATGGIALQADNVLFENVHMDSTSAVVNNTKSYCGAFVGTATGTQITFKKCSFDGTLGSAQDCGVFLAITSSSSVTIENCSVGGSIMGTRHTGGYIGYTGTGTTTIKNCSFRGTITCSDRDNDQNLGGYIGASDATRVSIQASTMSGVVQQGLITGGFVGLLGGTDNELSYCTVGVEGSDLSFVSSSRAYATSTEELITAGFVGKAANLTMQNCINHAPVTSMGTKNARVAGFVAFLGSGTLSMDACLNLGKISLGTPDAAVSSSGSWQTAPSVAGLLAGFAGNVTCPSISITNCGNEGTIYMNNSAALDTYGGLGGLISGTMVEEPSGSGSMTVENCYNVGNIDVSAVGGFSVGGVIHRIYTYGKVKLNKLYSAGKFFDRGNPSTSAGLITSGASERKNITMTNCFAVKQGDLTLSCGQIYAGADGAASVENNAALDSTDSEITVDSKTTTIADEIAEIRKNALKHDVSLLTLDTSKEGGHLKMALRVKEPFGFMVSTSPLLNGNAVELSQCVAEFGVVFLVTAEPLSVQALMDSEDAIWVVGEQHAVDSTRFVACYEHLNVSNVEQTVYFAAYIRDLSTGEIVATSKTARYMTPYVEIQNGAKGSFSTGVSVGGAEKELYESIVEYKNAYEEYYFNIYQKKKKVNYFDVVSYNIVDCINHEKDYIIDPDSIVNALYDGGAEIMMLCEVDINSERSAGDPDSEYFKSGSNQPKYIAEKLTEKTGVQHYWAFSVDLNNWHPRADHDDMALEDIYGGGWIDPKYTNKHQAIYGNALITTYPIVSCREIKFWAPNHVWGEDGWNQVDSQTKAEPKTALIADLDVNGTIVTAISTHYGWTSADNLIASPAIIEELKKIDTPVVLAGDLNNYLQYNAGSYDNALSLLMQYLNPTVTQSTQPVTFPAKGTCIDFIFVSEEIDASHAWSDTTKHASDHYPVYSRMAAT